MNNIEFYEYLQEEFDLLLLKLGNIFVEFTLFNRYYMRQNRILLNGTIIKQAHDHKTQFYIYR